MRKLCFLLATFIIFTGCYSNETILDENSFFQNSSNNSQNENNIQDSIINEDINFQPYEIILKSYNYYDCYKNISITLPRKYIFDGFNTFQYDNGIKLISFLYYFKDIDIEEHIVTFSSPTKEIGSHSFHVACQENVTGIDNDHNSFDYNIWEFLYVGDNEFITIFFYEYFSDCAMTVDEFEKNLETFDIK